jgi:hypothetical protein
MAQLQAARPSHHRAWVQHIFAFLDAKKPAQKFFLIKYYFFFMPNFQQTETYEAFKKGYFLRIMTF